MTFDPARVSEADVRRWMQLAENGLYPTVIKIDFCFDEPKYEDCGKAHEGVNLHNARLNLDKMRAVIKELDSRHDPPGLQPVVSFLKRTQTFWLWMETQKSAFLESGDAAVLESEFDHVDPKRSCGSFLDQIHKSKDTAEAWHLVQNDWNNCVWDEGWKQIGPYPREAWKSFVASQGIRERIGSTIEE